MAEPAHTFGDDGLGKVADGPTHCAGCGLPANPLFACDEVDQGWRCNDCFEKTSCGQAEHSEGCETIMWRDHDA